MGKNKGGAKNDRKSAKAEQQKKGRRRREVNLDQKEIASFTKLLLADIHKYGDLTPKA